MFDSSTIIVDLDGTLFNIESFRSDFHRAAQQLGIAPEQVRETREQSWTHPENRSGYHQGRHASLLEQFCRHDVDTINRWMESHYERLGDYGYPDSHLFLDEMAAAGHNVVLLSHGDPKWQLRKFRSLGLMPYFDAVYVTRAQKEDFLSEWVKDESVPMLFVNDNPEENMRVAHRFPKMAQAMRRNLDRWEEVLYNKVGFPHFGTLDEIRTYAHSFFAS